MADSAACRILVLASTPDRAQRFVQRVKTLSADPSGAGDAGSARTPWTIANRYYTAAVHFEARALGAFAAHDAAGVPALVYVWDRGEPYRTHVPALAARLRAHDPEVALAVRFGAGGADDEDDVDAFVAAHGFEFVDGERAGADDAGRSAVPGLPRVVDALSTIMWPSLVQPAEARDDDDDDAAALLAVLPSLAAASRMQRELAGLERWLDADDDAAWGPAPSPRVHAHDDAAWGPAPSPHTHAPADDDAAAWGPAAHAHPLAAQHAFDDDFAAFVGAAPPAHTGASWHTLASDVGEDDADDDVDDDDDDGLPSRAEVAATARRLFAGAAPLDVPGAAPRAPSPPPADEHGMRAFDLSRVFGALQGMKEEIAGIADEGERRRAAARVALGLVYGLQRERDEEEEDGEDGEEEKEEDGEDGEEEEEEEL